MDQSHSVMGGRTGGEVSPVTFQKRLLLLEPCFLVWKEG